MLVADGRVHAVECGLRSDMTSPAAEFIEAMRCGQWREDPGAADFPDDAQIKHVDLLLSWFDLLAEDGYPPRRTSVNFLEDGVWEFKIGAARLSYFDTDGGGSYIPKNKIRDRANSQSPDDEEFWWYPIFDEYIRLGYPFPKTGQVAGPTNIAECLKLRAEDLEHDV
ncbi:hypothetical protein [Nocardioides sp.]|uniref:hypothetical protein n=1 Tax=Nocardioides sp. TaxID=35761 RepID=UPI0019C4C77E|nr:hypothetical protein [Nocardioides sp.]MBC7275026.1 hypothetical protein [Nocardioides sp.]